MTVHLAAMIGVALIAIGIAIVMRVLETVPRRERAEADFAAFKDDPFSLALLSGGPVRACDTTLVQLIERRLVRVADGRFSVGNPAPAGDTTEPQAEMLRRVADSGNDSIGKLRARWWTSSMLTMVRAWREQGFLIGPSSRLWSWAIVAAPAFIVQSIVLLTSIEPLMNDDADMQLVYMVVIWFLTGVIVPVVLTSRPGYGGRSVVSARGRAVVRLGRESTDGSQAMLVATGGFAAMTDARLRSEVQGAAPDSRWDSLPTSYEAKEVNARATVKVGMGTPQLDFMGY